MFSNPREYNPANFFNDYFSKPKIFINWKILPSYHWQLVERAHRGLNTLCRGFQQPPCWTIFTKDFTISINGCAPFWAIYMRKVKTCKKSLHWPLLPVSLLLNNWTEKPRTTVEQQGQLQKKAGPAGAGVFSSIGLVYCNNICQNSAHARYCKCWELLRTFLLPHLLFWIY